MVVAASCYGGLCFSVAGTGRLVRIKGRMNAAKYKEVLEESLLQSAHNQQAGAHLSSRHTWCQGNAGVASGQVSDSLWVAQPMHPDLNPIEHQWRDLKMTMHRCFPSNLIELERIYQEEWEKLPKSRCTKLVETYPRRFKAVITAKGASTR